MLLYYLYNDHIIASVIKCIQDKIVQVKCQLLSMVCEGNIVSYFSATHQ